VPKVASLHSRLPTTLARTVYVHKLPYQTVAERPAGITQLAFCTAHCTALDGFDVVAAPALATGARAITAASTVEENEYSAILVWPTAHSR